MQISPKFAFHFYCLGMLLKGMFCWNEGVNQKRGRCGIQEAGDPVKKKVKRPLRLPGETLGVQLWPRCRAPSLPVQGPHLLWLALWIPWQPTDSHSSPSWLPKLSHPHCSSWASLLPFPPRGNGDFWSPPCPTGIEEGSVTAICYLGVNTPPQLPHLLNKMRIAPMSQHHKVIVRIKRVHVCKALSMASGP